MYLYELIILINDNTIVKLYNENQELIATYDGKESINPRYNDCIITDIFSDYYNYDTNICAIGIEIDTEDLYND